MSEVILSFVKVADILKEDYPQLEVCMGNGTPIHVFQWQCEGTISIHQDRGVKCEDPNFIEKARQFITKAKEIHAGLVLTPEYSFPYGILDEIIDDKNKWPEAEKLWCLGTQGESRDQFAQKLSDWSQKEDVVVVDQAYSNVGTSSFVSPLIYLFITTSGKLCIIPQFKTHAMADPRLAFEGPGLCRGNTIFVFGAKDVLCKNVFFSLICADAVAIKAQEILDKIQEFSIIMFHPQLNPEPRYQDMRTLRKNLLDWYGKEVRIITLNWACGTKLEQPRKNFSIPWSSFFKKVGSKNLSDSSFRSLKEQNHKQGTAFMIDGHMEIWFSHRFEHCKSMYIRKGDHGRVSRAITTTDEPVTNHCYTYDNNTWTEMSDGCSSNILKLFDKHNAPFDFLYPSCRTSTCDKCKKSDYFFGTLFGHLEEGEIESLDESAARMLVGADDSEDVERGKKLELLLELKRNLERGNFPEVLYYFKDNNCQLQVHDEFPDQGRKRVNLYPINAPGHPYPEALVVITDKKTEEEVEELLTSLSPKLSKDYRNQILIYYKPVVESSFKYYDKHLIGTAYTNHNYSDGCASIKNPRISKESYGR